MNREMLCTMTPFRMMLPRVQIMAEETKEIIWHPGVIGRILKTRFFSSSLDAFRLLAIRVGGRPQLEDLLDPARSPENARGAPARLFDQLFDINLDTARADQLVTFVFENCSECARTIEVYIEGVELR